MKKIDQIPKEMLPDSVTYQKYIPNTGEGATWDTAVVLLNVKIDEQKQFRHGSNGAELVGNAMLFYDLVNSSGLTTKPTNESKVFYEDRTYTIVDTDILRGNSNLPHHYEILLK